MSNQKLLQQNHISSHQYQRRAVVPLLSSRRTTRNKKTNAVTMDVRQRKGAYVQISQDSSKLIAVEDEETRLRIETARRYEKFGKVLVVVMFIVSVVFLVPYSFRFLGEGSKIRPHEVWILFSGIMFVALLLGGRTFLDRMKANNLLKKELREKEMIVEQIYKCISPQVLGEMVVFPVQVKRRDAEKTRFLRLTDEYVQVELSEQGDPTSMLKDLCGYAFGSKYDTVVWVGGGKAGPTGLAVGVFAPGYDHDLAWRIGTLIEDQCPKLSTTTTNAW